VVFLPEKDKYEITIDEDDIALLDSLFAKNGSKCLDFSQELGVSDLLLGLGHGAIVEDCGLVAISSEDMTVNALHNIQELVIVMFKESRQWGGSTPEAAQKGC
jgi:hypothetical protein